MIFNSDSFRAIPFKMIVTQVGKDDKNWKGKAYDQTQRGQIECALLFAVMVAKKFWQEKPGEALTYQEIERQLAKHPHREWLPAAVLKLRDMNMFTLAFKNTAVMPGSNWIETEPFNPFAPEKEAAE